MDTRTALKNVKTVKMPYRSFYGTRYNKSAVVDIAHGTNVDLILFESGNMHVRLTGEGRALLRELKSQPRYTEKPYAEEYILFELLGDEFLCNGWDYAINLGEDWNVTLGTGASAFSDDHTIEDDGSHTFTRVWLDNYYAVTSLLERLEFGNLIFTWAGDTDEPSPMHFW